MRAAPWPISATHGTSEGTPRFLHEESILSIVVCCNVRSEERKTMRSRLVSLLGILLMTVALAAGAQGPTLAVTAATAKIDGVFEDREYSLVTEAAGIKLGLTRTPDTLFIGLSAPTTGWVSVGLGSRTMDGAIMYIGYISGATTELKVQKG